MTLASGDDIEQRIGRNRARFDELLSRAEDRLASDKPEAAATYAQVAAALAWHSPTGLFASARLESLLAGVARVAPVRADDAARGSEIRSVLHVLTTAYRVGGHTRLAWRWIERDDRRVHSVAVTRQLDEAMPVPLLKAVGTRGGRIYRIDRAAPGIVGRAAALRAAIAQADLVVLHTHPFDVVPTIALEGLDAGGARPPTILLNHADHLFWIGLSASDVVLHLRTSGARLSADRRGLSPERSGILPVPLSPAPQTGHREDSRRALGYSDMEVVALSVASSYKFGPAGGDGLLPLVRQAVERCPDLRVLAVGPGDRADWRAAEGQTDGRIRSLGYRQDLSAIYRSADIYLDSFPFSSLTSMLEAGQRGIPLLAYTDAPPAADVLAFDDPATGDLGILTRTSGDYLNAIERLVDDPEGRLAVGRQIKDAISREHEGEAWRAHLAQAYLQAATLHESPRNRSGMSITDPTPGPTGELDRRLVTLLDAQQSDAPTGVRGHLRFAPFGVRLEEWRQSRGSHRPLSMIVLLPERILLLGRRAGMLGRRARQAARRAAPTPSPSNRGGDAA